MDAPVWDVTVFTKNRDRLLERDIARGVLMAILADPQVQPAKSDRTARKAAFGREAHEGREALRDLDQAAG